MADHADDDELLAAASGGGAVAGGAGHPDDDALLAAAGGGDPTEGRPRGFLGSGGAGPGSVDPDEMPVTELPKVGMDRLSRHPKAMTDSDRAAAQARGASESHTDDPGVQAIIGGTLGAGAAALVPGAAATGAALKARQVAQGAVAGGTASKAQGGDFVTGAALGGALPTVPLIGRALTKAAQSSAAAARSIGEGAIERSAARGPVPTANVTAAVKKALAKASEHGHIGTPGALERGAIVGADEAAAALARRLGVKPASPVVAADTPATAVNEPVGPAQAAGWDPEGWRHDIAAKPSAVEPAAAPAASEAPAAAEAANADPIAVAREALRDPAVTPAQADALKKAIAGYEEKAKRIGPKPAPRSSEAATPEAPPEASDPASSGARPEQWGGRPSNTARPAPEWAPSDADAKFAKGLNMSVDAYRDMMRRRSPYLASVERLARAARSATSVDDFVREASSAGLPAKEAERIYLAAHPRAAESEATP